MAINFVDERVLKSRAATNVLNQFRTNVIWKGTNIERLHCNSLYQKTLFKLMKWVPGSYRCLCSETNQLISTRKQTFKSTTYRGSENLPFSMVGHLLAGELISSLLITLKQNQVKVAPAFADKAWQHLQMPWHWGSTAESGLHAGLGEFSILEEVFFRQPRPEECPQHHCHLQTELP